jgi:hypothetical protein
MIQRLIYKALTQGIEAIKADLTLLDDLFLSNYELDAKEVEGIKTFFTAKPPTVVHGYARTDQKPPIISILLASERQTETVLGDEAYDVMNEDDPDYQETQYANFWEHTYSVVCIAEHPDVCQYIYEIAKVIILKAKPTFIPYGVYGIQLSGSDVSPDPRYMPEHFFIRQLTVSCNAELLSVSKGSRLSKAFAVTGISIDSPEKLREPKKTKSLITVKTE